MSVQCPKDILYSVLKIISMFCFVFCFVFGKVDNSSESDDMSYYYEYQNYDYLLLMLLLLIIIKCWMLSFMVCSFFLIFYILYKEKKSFYTLPCCGQQAMGLLSIFYCASLCFLCRICFYFYFHFFFFFLPGGKTHSLSNISVRY